MQNGSRLEYVSVDVPDQQVVRHKVHKIGDWEKRIDACVAAAIKSHTVRGVFGLCSLDGTGAKVMNVNTNGVLYTAQAAGEEMLRSKAALRTK